MTRLIAPAPLRQLYDDCTALMVFPIQVAIQVQAVSNSYFAVCFHQGSSRRAMEY